MKDTQKPNSKFWVRLMAWILCILMVVSLAYLTAVMLVDEFRADDKENTESTEDHDHDGDGHADH